jgi:DnaJ-class molecular chaperone
VGKRRKDSDRFKLERLQKPEEHRDTLCPCEACGGHGYHQKRVTDFDGRRYRTIDKKVGCNWCKGSGSVTKALAVAFHRWRRILRHNRAAGTCPKE